MVDLDDVAELALALPETAEDLQRGRTWVVAGKVFAWERPLTKADIKRLAGSRAPEGSIIAVMVDDLGEKHAVLAESHPGFFDIQHFVGFPAVLIQLDLAAAHDVREALVDGWLATAPRRLADDFLANRPDP